MKYILQTASNGAKVNQHPQMDGVWTGWMMFGRCMDRTLFFVGSLFSQLTSQWLRVLKLGFIQLWMASKQANGGGALVAPAAHQPLSLDQCWADIIFLRYPLDKISIFFFLFFFPLSDKDIIFCYILEFRYPG
jgi:hypothetical protein